MLSISSSGSTDGTEAWLKKLAAGSSIFNSLSRYGAMGISALAAATPVDEGTTAASWYYEIIQEKDSWSIVWGNDHVVDGRPIAVLLQYGHGTGTGGYVQGRDYINPALASILDQMTEEGWKVVIAT